MNLVRRALERGQEGGAIQAVPLCLLTAADVGMWREIDSRRPLGIQTRPLMKTSNSLYSHVMPPELTKVGAARLNSSEANQKRSTGRLYENLQEPLKGLAVCWILD
jgi:hypothetical protein